MVRLIGDAKSKPGRKATVAKKASPKAIARHAPITEKNKHFYVTTAIDYTNAPPHIGHSLEKVQADVLARWHRAKGEKVFFLTGTDEHGQKVEKAADAAGLTPQQFVDKLVPTFKSAWKSLNLSFDRFIRTTDADHIKIAIELVKKIAKKGDIYKAAYEGPYCEGCERFYTERELEGGNCPIHGKKCETIKEEGYFFRLSAYRNRLLEFYESNPHFIIPEGRRNEIINRVKEELKDVSVTRAVKWGIPFPLDGRLSTYVWFDALPNYITALGWPDGKLFKEFWPADVHCIGKDIAWFHCVIWPAILLSAGVEPPKTVFVHGYLTVNGEKISKSLGNVIDPAFLVQKYGADTVRYFLLREIPSTEDGDFNEKALIVRHNSELADQLGNLVNRALVLCEKFSDGKVPKPGEADGGPDVHLIADSLAAHAKVERDIDEFKFHDALTELWRLVARANAYVNETKPWELKGQRQQTVLYNLLESVRFIAVLLKPFLPGTAENILGQLGLEKEKEDFSTLNKFGGLKAGTKLKRGEILFKKIENEIGRHTTVTGSMTIEKGGEKMEAIGNAKKTESHTKPEVTIDEFSRLDLRVAEITKAEEVKGSDKLVKLQIDLGEGMKQIVAGIRTAYPPSSLVGKQIIVVNNLKPREYKNFGVTSYAMLLAAGGENGPVLLTLDRKVRPGSSVS